MSFPQHPKKHREEALFTPRHFFRYLRSTGEAVPRAPSTFILCYSRDLKKFAVEALHARQAKEAPEFILLTPERPLGFIQVGIGAPSLAMTIEELMARGARRFVSVGFAGCLQPDLDVGTTVLCKRAIRDEGTSYHYTRASKYAYPSGPLTALLRRGLEAQGVRVRTGASWTVDAVYRETRAEVQMYQAEGVLTVEMEASALFSVARASGAEAAALFTISDILDETGWVPRFVQAKEHLQSLLKQTVLALATDRPC